MKAVLYAAGLDLLVAKGPYELEEGAIVDRTGEERAYLFDPDGAESDRADWAKAVVALLNGAVVVAKEPHSGDEPAAMCVCGESWTQAELDADPSAPDAHACALPAAEPDALHARVTEIDDPSGAAHVVTPEDVCGFPASASAVLTAPTSPLLAHVLNAAPVPRGPKGDPR